MAWRLLPLLAGVAELGFFVVHGHPVAVSGQVLAFVAGFGLIIAGLIIAGPWLTMAGARFLARHASRPGALIAARRLAGARLVTLRWVVTRESAVPLLAVAVVAIGAGFAAAAMYASAEMRQSLVAPGPEYYLITVAGVAISVGIIAATFPLLRRITGPEAARNE